jgi:hypothetical protein
MLVSTSLVGPLEHVRLTRRATLHEQRRMDELLKLLGFGSPVAYAAGTYGLFHWLDTNASDEAKVELTHLLQIRDYDRGRVSAAVVAAFDRVYTRPLLSWRAFFRSAIITVFITVLFGMEVLISQPAFFKILLNYVPPIMATSVLSSSLITNVGTDYVCLFVIRRWLVAAARRPIMALFVSFVIGASVVYGSIVFRVLGLIMFDPSFRDENFFSAMYSTITALFHLPDVAAPGLFLLFPAMAVFAWLLLFGMSLGIIRLFNLLAPVVGKVQWAIKGGRERPLIAVGCVAAAIVFVAAVAWRLVLPTPEPTHAPEHLALSPIWVNAVRATSPDPPGLT